jgi:aryl-alcohol dehydrogenase-like predicted oxidoreductase
VSSDTSPQSFAERMRVFLPNRQKFPPERLAPFAGQWVAFNAEGTDILAGAPDLEQLAQRLAELNINTQDVVFDYVDDGSICLGAAEML